MSTRIIIEKDGERYVANDLTVKFIDNGRFLGIEKKTDTYCYLGSTFTKLPPVERTDNSEVIANLEAENAKIAKCLEEFMLAAEMVLPVDVLEQYNRAKLVKRCRKALKEAKKIGGEE